MSKGHRQVLFLSVATLAGLTTVAAGPAFSQSEPTARTIVLEEPRPLTDLEGTRKIVFGEAVVVSGRIDTSDVVAPECAEGVEVTLLFDPADDLFGNWEEVATTISRSDGGFSFNDGPENSGTYRAEVPHDEAQNCGAASDEESLSLRAYVALTPSRKVVERGERVRLFAEVKPICESDNEPRRVRLYKLVRNRFEQVAAKQVEPDCTVAFRLRVGKSTAFYARVGELSAHVGQFLAGKSELVVIRVR